MPSDPSRRSWIAVSRFLLTLLAIEFLDELVFGAGEAAWPLIRNDLGLSYLQIGSLLSLPAIFANLIEPAVGILGDTWKRRALVLAGGVIFALSLFLTASSWGYIPLLISFMLFFPASGAFVNLSQAALMDAEPVRREQNLARWTFAGSLGMVLGPLGFGLALLLGSGWRFLYGFLALLAVITLAFVWRLPLSDPNRGNAAGNHLAAFFAGARNALTALKRVEVLRWLVLLEFSDLMLDILLGFLALYFVDVVRVTPAQASLAVGVWTGVGLLGDLLLIPLLERISGLDYLRLSAALELVLYGTFLVLPGWPIKLLALALLGFFNSGWYAILQARLYAALPGQSGTALAVKNVSGLLGGLIPLGLGWVAQRYNLQVSMWLLSMGPVVLLLGLPRHRRDRSN